MKKILFVCSDAEFINTVAMYLNWHGLEITRTYKSTAVIPELNKHKYDLLICHVFIKPDNGYRLCQQVRRICGITKILLIGPETPAIDMFIILEKENIYFMNQYLCISKWIDKINALI